MKHVLPVIVKSRKFSPHDLIGGDPAIDFINTVTGRDQTPRDWLDCYARLLEWAALTQLLPEKLLRALNTRMKKEPAEAEKALTRAKDLREALFSVVTATIADKAPAKSALALLRAYWIAGTDAHELRFVDGQLSLVLRNDAGDFSLIASMIAYRMVEYVMPVPKERLRICQGPNCSWLFIDRSKAGRRCWCDMAVCGNAAKSRRHQVRSREK